MASVFAGAIALLLFASTMAAADAANASERTMPYQEECATLLPADFWDDSEAKPFQSAEAWAWNERICLGRWADMRHAPGRTGDGTACQPAEIEKKDEAAPTNRELRPEFLELILSHEPWVSAPRRPQVLIRCALVRGNFVLDDHEIGPTFAFHHGKIDGKVSLVGTRLKRTLSLEGSTITGRFSADRLEVGGDLLLRAGGMFTEVDLRRARISGNAAINGSIVAGLLNADGLEVGGTLFLHDGGSFQGIDLLGASIAGDAAFVGSTVTGPLRADGLVVGGSLQLRDATMFAGIRLLGARIAINAELNGSTVTGLLNADGLEVGGSLFLRDDATFADIDLLGGKIAGNAEFNGSTVTGLLNADRLEVGGDLLLRDGGTFEDIDLVGAKIAGNAAFNGSTITGRFDANRLEVGGTLLLHDGGTFKNIDLLGAKIRGDVQLSGSSFGGELDLTGAAIGGELHLSSGWHEFSPTWKSGASLILRNAKAVAVQARGSGWNMSSGDGLLPTDLTGFTFIRLGGLDTSGGTSMVDNSTDWLIGWIEAQRDHGDIYDPQPYTQLAQVLDAAGATEKARAIRYAKFNHKLEHDESVDAVSRVVLMLERLIVGYGVYPFRALWWFFGLVLLGALLAQCSKDASVRRAMGLWYSFENALPLIETRERFKNVTHGHPCLVHLFHLQKALGFVLATVLVGALALLSG